MSARNSKTRRNSRGRQDSFVDNPSKRRSSNYTDNSVRESQQTSSVCESAIKPKINYQTMVVNEFYYYMLDLVVESWQQATPEEVQPSIASGAPPEDVISKDFRSLTDLEMSNSQVVSVEGSQVSLSKRMKKRSTSGSKHSKSKKWSKPGSPSREKEIRNWSNMSREISAIQEEVFKSVSDSLLKKSVDKEEFLIEKEFVRVTFRNGNVYAGPTVNKSMEGVGEFVWANGAYYRGEFEKGELTGRGVLILPDLSYYVGDFCKGFFHGEGTLYISRGNMMYSGGWKAGRKCGKGWLVYKEGNWYDGEWCCDKRHGYGFRQYALGIRYKGDWKDGYQHGTGTMLYCNSDVYRGGWKNGLPHGQGEYTWNATLHREFVFPIQNYYQGGWANGMRNGAGVMDFGYENGAAVAGFWEDNKIHGAGVIVCGNGKIVERNPLFQDAKPAHVRDLEDSIDIAEKIDYTRSKSLSQVLSIDDDVEDEEFGKILKDTIKYYLGDADDDHPIICIKPHQFPYPRVVCTPVDIPIFASPIDLDLTYYLHLISLRCRWNCHIFSMFDSLHPPDDTSIDLLGYDCPCPDKEKCFTTLPPCADFMPTEESRLRAAISRYYPKILDIYKTYALLACKDKTVDCKPILIRMFLWQLYRDVGVMKKGYSLADLDCVHTKNRNSGVNSEHDPFERLFMWQFIQILLDLGNIMCNDHNDKTMSKNDGIAENVLMRVVDDVILPNIGRDKGLCLYEYNNILPIMAVYKHFISFGEVLRARTLLNSMCVRKGREVPCSYKSYADEGMPDVRFGVNTVPFASNIIFIPDDKPFFELVEEKIPEDPFFKSLYVFRTLGPKKIVECMKKVCPQMDEGLVFTNMEYQLVFIEFYDILIACAYEMIDKVKKHEAKMKRRAEITELMEQGLWVSSREVASKTSKGKKGKK